MTTITRFTVLLAVVLALVGRPLRFSYGGLPPVTSIASRPLPSAVFETAGEETITFDAYDVNTAALGSHQFHGYMLFPSEGDWAIETFSGDAVLGTAVLRVKARAPWSEKKKEILRNAAGRSWSSGQPVHK